MRTHANVKFNRTLVEQRTNFPVNQADIEHISYAYAIADGQIISASTGKSCGERGDTLFADIGSSTVIELPFTSSSILA